jgi:hypothetical protein
MDRETGDRIGQGERAAMGSANRLKLGLFGANCASGRAVTMVPERWSGSIGSSGSPIHRVISTF